MRLTGRAKASGRILGKILNITRGVDRTDESLKEIEGLKNRRGSFSELFLLFR